MKKYEVKMKCVVYKVVTVECESENTAWSEPWEHSTDEQEVDQVDWEVLSVTEIE